MSWSCCMGRCINVKWTIRNLALKTFIPETNPKCLLGRKPLGEGGKKSTPGVVVGNRKRRRPIGGSCLSYRKNWCQDSALKGENEYTVEKATFTTNLNYR